MDNESLDWLAVQCQFRNGLAAAALDSMAYTLLCEVVERTPYWCDPVHYVELDMGKEEAPEGVKFSLVTLKHQVSNPLSTDGIAFTYIAHRLKQGLAEVFSHHSGRILAGTLRAQFVPSEHNTLDIYVSYIVVNKETTDGRTNDTGTDSTATVVGCSTRGCSAGSCP